MDTHATCLVASDWFINKRNDCKANSNEDIISIFSLHNHKSR